MGKRAFQAEMTIKYCGGSACLSETVFGWNRNTVKLALAEKRSGIRDLRKNRIPAKQSIARKNQNFIGRLLNRKSLICRGAQSRIEPI